MIVATTSRLPLVLLRVVPVLPLMGLLSLAPLAGALRAVSNARHGGRGADLLPLVPTTVSLLMTLPL